MTAPPPSSLLSSGSASQAINLGSAVPYRKDINGLRAWAVIAVMLFHFNIPGMQSGFIGVDVFFVISGFLMTAIIVKGLESGSFSIGKFYAARARRILPALSALIAILLALGWFILPDTDYKQLGAQSTYAMSLVSNIYFWKEADYFAPAAHENWLLHTWSLAVEAHFYILFPLFLSILWRFCPKFRTAFWGVGFLFVASLVLSIAISGWQRSVSFYLIPTRGWELAAGGLAFLIGRELPSLSRFSKPLFWIGVGLLAVGASILTSSFTWPSGWALLPVMGTALIILANNQRSKLTANPVMQWLGDRSYSLYLWHWPLVVALNFSGLGGSAVWTSSAILASLLLAHLSYHLVELPTHNRLVAKSLKGQALAISGFVLLLVCCSTIVLNFNLGDRISPAVNKIAAESANKNYAALDCKYQKFSNTSPGCIFGKKTTDAILIGDSHSEAVASALTVAAENHGKGYVYYGGAHGCPTLSQNTQPKCTNYNTLISEKIKLIPAETPLVIINSSWGYIYTDEEFRAALVNTVCSYTNTGRTVYINRPIPMMPVHVPNTMSRAMLFGREIQPIKINLDEYLAQNKRVLDAQDEAVKQCGAKILDPLPYLCANGECSGSENGMPLYYDSGHLSEYGNKRLVPMFESIFGPN